MVDYGHKETDKLLADLEKKIAKEYQQAVKETQAKLDDYLRRFEIKDEKWRLMVANGTKTQAEYNEWRKGQIMIGKRWEEMRNTLAQDYHNANVIARATVDGGLPDAYAINHNYATFEVEKGGKVDTSYTLYDRDTVENLMQQEDLLPPIGRQMQARIAAGKDIKWQEGQIQSVTLQAILQGESIPNMAKRIAQTMGETNHKSTIRYARTAVTSAENKGRLDGYTRASDMGIKMRQTWVATLDGRTRHEHRMLDGQTVDVDEPFKVDGYELRFPGDPTAPGYLIWNCRCTTIAQVKGFERDVTNLDLRRDEKLGDMSYDEWKEAKAESQNIEYQEQLGESMKWATINELYRGGGIYNDGKNGIIKSVTVGDIEEAKKLYNSVSAKGEEISDDVFSAIQKAFERNNALSSFDSVAVADLGGEKVFDTVLNQVGTFYHCDLKINKNFFGGVPLETVESIIKESNVTVCNTIDDCVFHEYVHAKATMRATADVVDKYNNMAGISAVSPTAGKDMLETLSEVAVAKRQGIYESFELSIEERAKIDEAAKELGLW